MNYGRVNSGSERLDATLQQKTFTPDRFPFDKHATTYGIDGFSEVIINAPVNFSAENIKKDVTIAGVTGTFEGSVSTLGTADIKPATFPTVKNASDDGVDGYSTVTVQAPDNLVAENIKSGVSIAGVTGTYEGSGSGGTDAEAEFWKAMMTSNDVQHPANAGPGLLVSHISKWPQNVYIGSEGIDLTSVKEFKVNLEHLDQFYSTGGFNYEIGGPIRMNSVCPLLRNSILAGLPLGEWQVKSGLFSGCSFYPSTIELSESNVVDGHIYGQSFMNIAGYDTLHDMASANKVSATLILPSNITQIDDGAISGSTTSRKLSLVMKATTPPTLAGSRSLNYISSITVPVGTLEAYQTATNWSAFADIMVEATADAGTTEAGA